jgi:hypothetical protein
MVRAVISDRDVWHAALLLVKRYGDDAMLEAAQRADQMLDEGDMADAETWHRILNAIERLQAKARRLASRFPGRCLTATIVHRWRLFEAPVVPGYFDFNLPWPRTDHLPISPPLGWIANAARVTTVSSKQFSSLAASGILMMSIALSTLQSPRATAAAQRSA